MIQTGGDLSSVTLAEYDNWLGKSTQTWLDRGLSGLFDGKRYTEVPKIRSDESLASNELAWIKPIHHWRGECLPQDVYEEYDKLVTEALNVENRLNSSSGAESDANRQYKIRQEVMFGKYNMRSESEQDSIHYHYPDYCTEDAYDVNYGQVWYNRDNDMYYDRGALDVAIYMSPRIKYTYREETHTSTDAAGNTYTYVVTYFDAYYTIEYLTYHSDNTWSSNAVEVLGNQLRLTTGKDEIVSSGNLTNILASGTLFRSAGGTCRTAFGQVPLRKARPTDTLFSDLYNFPGEAAEIMDFIRAAARRKMLSLISIFRLGRIQIQPQPLPGQ